MEGRHHGLGELGRVTRFQVVAQKQYDSAWLEKSKEERRRGETLGVLGREMPPRFQGAAGKRRGPVGDEQSKGKRHCMNNAQELVGILGIRFQGVAQM